ncbi:MAG: hypothetical protein WBZ51_18655, partial [Xanthobacteraceae bacterium]
YRAVPLLPPNMRLSLSRRLLWEASQMELRQVSVGQLALRLESLAYDNMKLEFGRDTYGSTGDQRQMPRSPWPVLRA